MLAILPPILHFFTGPIAPAIGGFVARRAFGLDDREVMVMGGLLAAIAGIPAYLVLRDVSFLGGTASIIAAIVAALYIAGLATFAALFAGVDEEPAETDEAPAAD